MGLLQSIRQAAKRDARAFVQEFGESLDHSKTDWGHEAFSPWEHGLRTVRRYSNEDPSEGLYHEARVNNLRVTYEKLVARYTRKMVIQ